MTRFIALALLLSTVSGAAFAQDAQSPPTDPQSKRQQESPVVKGPGYNETKQMQGSSTVDMNETTLTPGSDPIARTAPAGAVPELRTDKAGPLQEKN